MASLSNKIIEYCKANNVSDIVFERDVVLQDDMVDGVSNPYIKEWNLDIAKPTTEQIESYETIANETEANFVDAKVSGNQKLLDLGLTQAEATALTGYTPPVAE